MVCPHKLQPDNLALGLQDSRLGKSPHKAIILAMHITSSGFRPRGKIDQKCSFSHFRKRGAKNSPEIMLGAVCCISCVFSALLTKDIGPICM
jgi:hypothetical protein